MSLNRRDNGLLLILIRILSTINFVLATMLILRTINPNTLIPLLGPIAPNNRIRKANLQGLESLLNVRPLALVRILNDQLMLL